MKDATGWAWMRPTNEDQPKVKAGVKLTAARLRVAIVAGPAWGWNCPYMRCLWKLEVPAGEGYGEACDRRDAHLKERHSLRGCGVAK